MTLVDQHDIDAIWQSIGMAGHKHEDDVVKITVSGNRVLGAHLLPGVEVDADEKPDGVAVDFRILDEAFIAKPIQLCFGVMPETGMQHIELNLNIGENSRASVVAHCTFPNAVDVVHRMDAVINVGRGACYSYFERHVHGPAGGVTVVPKAKINLGADARFKTEFELIKGRVGVMDIDYEAECEAGSVIELIARIIGAGDDRVKINETAHLRGERSRAFLQSYLALKHDAFAEVYNTVTAHADGAKGHVDCKEIVQGRAVARAVPIVDVRHPGAHVTHEAAIGSVDSKQLQTLLARGLDEEAATDLIIEGMLG